MIYGILAGINRDHEGFNSDLVDIYNQSGGTAVLDVLTKRAMHASVNHWLFFLIAVPTLIAFVYLLVASPRAKLKSEFEEKRKSAQCLSRNIIKDYRVFGA